VSFARSLVPLLQTPAVTAPHGLRELAGRIVLLATLAGTNVSEPLTVPHAELR